jgi:hypothetical protein
MFERQRDWLKPAGPIIGALCVSWRVAEVVALGVPHENRIDLAERVEVLVLRA